MKHTSCRDVIHCGLILIFPAASFCQTLLARRRWSKCSWFSNPPSIRLQASAEAAPNNDPACKAAKIGGAAAHNRFAGRSAVPLATTAPLDGSPMISNHTAEPQVQDPRPTSTAVQSGELRQASGAGPRMTPVSHVRAPVAQPRPGHTCDGSAAAQRAPSYVSPWKFDWEHMNWENASADTSAGADVKAALAARRCTTPAVSTWHP